MSGKVIDWAADHDSSEEEGDHHDEPAQDSQEIQDERPVQESQKLESNSTGQYIAYVANLPFTINEDQLGQHFYSLGCDVKYVKIHRDSHDNRSKGYSHITFGDENSFQIALKANNSTLHNRQIRVDVSEGREKRPFKNRKDDRGGRGGFREDRKSRENRDNRDWTKAPHVDKDGPSPRSNEKQFKKSESQDVRKSAATKESVASVDANTAPVERKKLNLQPRTLPIQSIDQPALVSTSIFGKGKARDESAYEEEKKKKVEADKLKVEPNVTIESNVDEKPVDSVIQPPRESMESTNLPPPTNRSRGESKKKEFGTKNAKPTQPRKESDHEDREKNRTDRKKIFSRANNAPVKKSSDAKPVEPTDEEKFIKAQQSIAKKESIRASESQKGSMKANAFNALASDGEDSS